MQYAFNFQFYDGANVDVELNLMEGMIDCRRVIMSAGLHSFTVHPALRCDVIVLCLIRRGKSNI